MGGPLPADALRPLPRRRASPCGLQMDYGLPPALRDEIRATHKRVTENTRRWRREDGQLAYAGSNASELAELAERKSRPGLSEGPAP